MSNQQNTMWGRQTPNGCVSNQLSAQSSALDHGAHSDLSLECLDLEPEDRRAHAPVMRYVTGTECRCTKYQFCVVCFSPRSLIDRVVFWDYTPGFHEYFCLLNAVSPQHARSIHSLFAKVLSKNKKACEIYKRASNTAGRHNTPFLRDLHGWTSERHASRERSKMERINRDKRVPTFDEDSSSGKSFYAESARERGCGGRSSDSGGSQSPRPSVYGYYSWQGSDPVLHVRGACSEFHAGNGNAMTVCEDCCTLEKLQRIDNQNSDRARSALIQIFDLWRSPDFPELEKNRLKALFARQLGGVKPNRYGVYRLLACVYEERKASFSEQTKMFMYDVFRVFPVTAANPLERFDAFLLAVQKDPKWALEKYFSCPELKKNENTTHFRAQGKTFRAQLGFEINHNIAVDPSGVMRIIEMLSAQVGKIADALLPKVVGFVGFLIILCSNADLIVKMTAGAMLVAQFSLSKLIPDAMSIIQRLTQVFQGVGPRFVAQGETEDSESLVMGVAKLLMAMGGVVDIDTAKLKRLSTRVDAFARVITAGDKLTSVVMKLFHGAEELIMRYVYGLAPGSWELRTVEEKIPEWMTKVFNFYNRGGLARVAKERDSAMMIFQWKEEGDKYLMLLTECKVAPRAFSSFRIVYQQCLDMAKAGAHYHSSASLRAAPLVVYLWGNPGVGKSVTQNVLITDIMREVYRGTSKVFTPGQDIYTRNSTQKHWDAYANQPVVVFDDYLQDRTPEAMAEQLMDLLRMNNIVSYPLNMAGLEAKGNTYFSSELVMITSNIPIPSDAAAVIRSVEAIRRRVDFSVQQVLKPGWATNRGHLDRQRVQQECPPRVVDGVPCMNFPEEAYEFRVETSSGQTLNLSYQELVAHCLERFQSERAINNQLIALLNTRADPSFKAQGLRTACASAYGCVVGFVEARREIFYDAIGFPEDEYLSAFRNSWSGILAASRVFPPLLFAMAAVFVVSFFGARAINSAIACVAGTGNTSASDFTSEAGVSGDPRTQKHQVRFAHEANVSGDPRTAKHHASFAREANVSGDQKTLKHQTRFVNERMRERKSSVEYTTPQAEGMIDRQAYDALTHKIANNCCVVSVSDGQSVTTMRGIFVFGRVLLVPAHLLHAVDVSDGAVELIVQIPNNMRMSAQLRECQTLDLSTKGSDIVAIELPKRYPNFVDISKHFHSVEDLNRHYLSSGILWVVDPDNRTAIATILHNLRARANLRYEIDDVGCVEEIRINKGFLYEAPTMDGYCGSPIIWTNPGVMHGKILGFHVAGAIDEGMAVAIDECIVSIIRDHFPSMTVLPPKTVPMTAQARFETNLPHYGVVESGVYRVPVRSKIKPSKLHGVFPTLTAPAMLRPTRDINPLANGIRKQEAPLTVFEQELVDAARDDVANNLCAQVGVASGIGVVGEKEALNGIPGYSWFPPMDMHTSPGYPYVLEKNRRPGKFSFIQGEPGSYELTPYMREEVEKRHSFCLQRTMSPALVADMLKDERRPLAKVQVGNTRVFNVCPFDLNILIREYFGSFVAHVMEFHNDSEIAIGINPHSGEWGMLHEQLLKHPMWIGGDYSSFDKTLSFQCLLGALEVIEMWYKSTGHWCEEDLIVREVLFHTAFSSFHLAGDEVYRTLQGNPSGIVMTAVINSLVNCIYYRVAWQELGLPIRDFTRLVCLRTYGDDSIGTVSRIAAKTFNMLSLSRVLAEHGVVYTPPSKGSVNMEFLEEHERVFLKRRFRKDRGRMYAPLDINTIREMIQWVRESNDDLYSMQLNFEAACREWYHHGVEVYEEQVKYVQDFARLHHIRLPVLTYTDAGQYWGSGDNYSVIFSRSKTANLDKECCYDGDEGGEILASASAF